MLLFRKNTNRKLATYFLGILIGSMATPIMSLATEITPSHVYQKTETLRQILDEADVLETRLYEETLEDEALRHPRHVMQKVRECHTILSRLLEQNKIKVDDLPDLFSIREVRPSDVENGVNHLIKNARKLTPGNTVDALYVPGKVPSDVYNNLKRICASTRAEIIPSDVFQVVKSVNENLDKLMQVRGYDIEISYQSFENKIPADVYQKTWEFLEDLRTLALNPDFAIPGGVIVPNQVPGHEITPQDVIALMNDALAETNAMKYTLGVREKSILPEYQDQKTPSDVFSQIDRAHNVVKTLLQKEAEEE